MASSISLQSILVVLIWYAGNHLTLSVCALCFASLVCCFEHFLELDYVFIGFLVCCLVQEVGEHQLVLGYLVVSQESIEEQTQLHHPLLQEFWLKGSKHFLLGKLRKEIEVSLVHVLLDDRLELAHAGVPVYDVEADANRSEHFEYEFCVLVGHVVLNHLDLVGEFV